jgi:hypothetical protein
VKFSKWHMGCAAATAGLAMVASLPIGQAAAQPKAPSSGPLVKLIAAQKFIKVPEAGKFVFLDPGVYVAAFRSKLEFDVQRASYRKPLTITEIIHVPGVGVIARPLPSWLLSGWNGLARFLRISVANSRGKAVASHVLPFCPNSGNPQRTNPNSPPNSPFPQECSSDPFELGMVEGLQRGWAEDPISGGYLFGGEEFKLKPGSYKVTVNIVRGWRRILHVTRRDATATVHVRVVKQRSGCIPPFCLPGRGQAKRRQMLPELPAAPTMTSPPKADLPDLIPLPSWGISIQNTDARHKPKDSSLDFGATVWIGGNARLDVEGFRRLGTNTMEAYQYFWHNGRVVGRAKVGTMGFSGYNSWHFQQFAQYRLLNARKSVVVRSQKVGFCIAATDPVDLLLPHATWVPEYTGLSGACGDPSALWVTETLPVGWGDTYFQYIPHQSFDITHLQNGTYYIEIIANPERVLHETNTHNDISLRKVIIGGTPGHKTVRVPALDGIDPEG